MASAHRFTEEPRWCSLCDEHAEPSEIICAFCTSPTRLLSDVMENAWQRQHEDALSEPPVSVNEMHARAWRDRETLRHGGRHV